MLLASARLRPVCCSPSRVAGALAALWFGSALPAHAAELSLRGPAACGDRDELAFRVERSLGSPLAGAPALGLDVTIAARARGLSATLRVREPAADAAPSERKLEAADCARLLDALAVVIVLAIDRARAEATAASEPAAPPPVPVEPVEPVHEAPIPDSGAPAEPKSNAASFTPGVLAWLAGDMGSLPDPDLGVGLGLSLDSQRVRWQASGLFFFEQHSELTGQAVPAPGADLALALGALSACYAPDGSWQSDGVLGVCLRGELGRLFGRGTDLRAARSGGRLWAAPGLSLAGAWRLLSPSLRLAVEVGAVLPLLRSEFHLGTLGELYRPAPVSARAGLGLEIVLK